MRKRSANTEVLGDQPMLPLEEDQPMSSPADEPPVTTRRVEVLLERLQRVRDLPEGYPGREDAIARHLEALREEGVELTSRSGEVE